MVGTCEGLGAAPSEGMVPSEGMRPGTSQTTSAPVAPSAEPGDQGHPGTVGWLGILQEMFLQPLLYLCLAVDLSRWTQSEPLSSVNHEVLPLQLPLCSGESKEPFLR